MRGFGSASLFHEVLMIVTLTEVKTRLRIDDSTQDTELELLIEAAEVFIYQVTGVRFQNTNKLAKVVVFFIIQDLYEKRTLSASAGYKSESVSDKTRQVVDMILNQLAMYAVRTEEDLALTWSDLLTTSTTWADLGAEA
jgi:hypothetical protein